MRKAAAAVSMVSVGKYCYIGSAWRRMRCLGAHGEGEGRRHIVLPRTRVVSFCWYVFSLLVVLVKFQYLPSDWLE